jgi:hypothetical protein
MHSEFGPATANLVKRSMFEAVRRGIQVIRRERLAWLGFVHLRILGDALVPFDVPVQKDVYRLDEERIVVHASHVDELLKWWSTR